METELLPRIIVEKNPKRDKMLFANLLTDKRRLSAQRKLIGMYPELGRCLRSSDMEAKIAIFVGGLFSKYAAELDAIVAREQIVLDTAKATIFTGLAKVMEHRWEKGIIFYASPTFTHINPFYKNWFAFSVYKELILGEKPKRRLDRIALHEISHVVWYKKLEKVYKSLGYELNFAANYYLKEVFATIIGENTVFEKLNEGYSPLNKDVRPLRLRALSGDISFLDYFSNLYKRKTGKAPSFERIMEEAVAAAYSIQDELEEKKKFWNAGQGRLDRKAMEIYTTPITAPNEGV